MGYKPENNKKSRSYMNLLIAHSKAIPDPRKYSKIDKWGDDTRRSNLPKAKKVSLFTEVTLRYKKTPGPATYKQEKSRDKCILDRTKGTYKR